MEPQSMPNAPLGYTLADWQQAYRDGAQPADLLTTLLGQLAADDPAWISLASPQQLQRQLDELDNLLAAANGRRDALPLYGAPLAAKDHLDAAGWTTTAACPPLPYTAEPDAPVVPKLPHAG